MDSNVSYTKVEDVECLQDEKEGPQVVTPRNLGFFRGFFIMVAALCLTMLIGLVVVVVISDINDRPRQDGDYSHSRDIAQYEGCRFHIMGLDWLRPGCQDVEPIEKFRYIGPEDWYTDADLEEPCHMDEVPSRVEGSS
jgi:hypothetical protein